MPASSMVEASAYCAKAVKELHLWKNKLVKVGGYA